MGMGGLFDGVENDGWPVWTETLHARSTKALQQEAAKDVAEWLVRHLPVEILRAVPAALTVAMTPEGGEVPRQAELVEILEWWNGLSADGLVPHAVKTTKLSKEIVTAWRKWCRDGHLQELWENRDEIGRRIAAAGMCRSGWFRLEKILGGATNRDGTLIIMKLLDGGYDDSNPATQSTTTAAGWGAIQQFGGRGANRRPD